MLKSDRELIALGVVVAGYFLWRGYRQVESVVSNQLNPASSKNYVNRGVEAVGREVTGNPNWTLGGHIYKTVDSLKDALPFVDSDREKMAKSEASMRAVLMTQNKNKANYYNKLPAIF